MAIRRIYTADKPVLHQKAKPVQRIDATLRKLLDDMVETMRDAPGVGLAAPQIGMLLRVAVVEYEEQLYKVVNPEITWVSEERDVAEEGCLSIPDFVGSVERFTAIRVRAKDEKGKLHTIEAAGWLARIFQHEIDHLDGILYTDRMAPGERLRPAPAKEEEEAEPRTAETASHV